MAPVALQDAEDGSNGHLNGSNKLRRAPLRNSGSIDHLDYVDVTPIIGREYPTAKIRDMLYADDWEQQLRDLAITICERGVVFFRAPQDDLSVYEQKTVTDLLGKLTGRPAENGPHVHPLYNDPNNIPTADGTTDPNIYGINSEAMKKLYKTMKGRRNESSEPRDLGREWHSNSKVTTCVVQFQHLGDQQDTPLAGGDTLWCSGYQLYDRMSPSFRSYLETLTATCAQPVFKSACEAGGYEVMSPRGSPLNKDFDFSPSHSMCGHIQRLVGIHSLLGFACMSPASMMSTITKTKWSETMS